MRSCRTASVFAMGALLMASAFAACRERMDVDVPALTTARPDGQPSTPVGAALETDGGGAAEPRTVLADPLAKESPIKASFVDVPGNVDAPPSCSRMLVAVAKGKVTVLGESLATGDVLVLTRPDALKLEGSGLVVVARHELDPEACKSPKEKKIVRGTTAPKLEWAGGTMSAHLDVAPPKPDAGGVSPELYLGRLEGTAGVPEHIHAGSWEILAAVEANGTIVLEGTEGRVSARQITMIPPGAKHAWKPEPGSKLVAIQMYSPPGPEQRFVALAAADKAPKDAGPRN